MIWMLKSKSKKKVTKKQYFLIFFWRLPLSLYVTQGVGGEGNLDIDHMYIACFLPPIFYMMNSK